MKLLNDYLELQKQLFDYFGYVEDWRLLPVMDGRNYYWKLDQDANGSGEVLFADSIEELDDEDSGNYYSYSIYTNRHLPKWVYRGAEFTMVVVDTHTDGNQGLQIFDNAKEQK